MNKLKRTLCAFLAVLMLAGCSAPSDGGNAVNSDKLTDDNNSEGGISVVSENFKIADYSIGNIKATDAYCENAFEKEIKYLLSLENDRLLSNFRKHAGIDTNGAEPYNGWENSLIGGHTMGHYLTALAQAYTNGAVSSSSKKAIYKKMTQLVDELAKCQKDNGFLWGSTILNVGNIEIQFDNAEKGKWNLFEEAWVPWYTMHKIFEGFISVYQLTGYEPALEVVKKLGDWAYNRTQSWDEATHRTVLNLEYGGMNDALYDLYALTGEDRYAVAAHAFDEDDLFERIRSDGENILNDQHANTTIPKVMGALKRYEVLHGKKLDGKTVDASEYLETAETFWQMVIDHHTYATGANSEWERFGQDDVLNMERTNCNCETCNVYNMLKLTKDLFMITGDKKYADYYENAFMNHILASQNPETGMTTYFQAMATGYFRTFSTPTDSFWCCTGSGMENFTKLGDGTYFRTDNELYVNMYITSELDDPDMGLKLTQTSDIPLTDCTTLKLKLEDKKTFKLKLRIPDWAKGDITVTVNGEAAAYTNENGYAAVEREWSNKDVVKVTIPMGFTSYNLADGRNTVSFKYGPLLLAAKLSDENMTTTYTGMSVLIPEKTIIEDDTLILKDGITPVEVRNNPDKYFTRNEGMSFTFTATDDNLEFVPYYTLYNTRYGIYWKLKENQ